MCGIIGYCGSREVGPILLEGLRKLEYRGYDSCGIATINDGRFFIKKDVGKIDEVNDKLNLAETPGKIGIGHTRWSTHGGVNQRNSHPHLSNDGKTAVVHNGIVENYQELKDFLKGHGFKFLSETDTEVIPNLIQYYMDSGNDFFTACRKTLESIEGRYAIIAMSTDGKVAAARNGSPLVVGVGDAELFIASDIPSFVQHTKRIMYLSDQDLVSIENGEYKIYSLSEGSPVERPIESIEWDAAKAEKGEFKHFMLKEISEQVETIQKAIDQDEGLVDKIAEEIKKAKGIFLIGCGTSYHACLSASYIFSKTSKMHVNVVLASEFPNYKHFLNSQSLVIAVSQSGETADVLEAIKSAKAAGSKVISIVNVKGSSMHRESDYTLLMNSGPEICVLSTKSYTSQLALFILLAHRLNGGIEEGKIHLKSLYNDVFNLTSKSVRDHVQKIAEILKNKEHIFTIGRGALYPTALEAALKIKEVSYIHTEGFAGGELKHGTIALIEDGTPCIVFASKENMKDIISNAIEIKSRGGLMIGVGPENNEVFNHFIKVPDAGVCNPIVQAIPAQILAYQLAVLRGLDPDRPRNLAKSVTVK